MKRKKQANLVCQYLESISRTALEKYQEIIKKYVRGRHGTFMAKLYSLVPGDFNHSKSSA